MNYIELFEKFESLLITKTLNFLEKKINISTKKEFLNKLKNILNHIDFPISKLEDSDIQYLKKDKALLVKGKTTNEFDISYIKFWFSIERGFIGYSGTGNKKRNIYRLIDNCPSDNIIEHIKLSGIKTGKITPVTDYYALKTGDKVICVLNTSYNQDFIQATIFVEQGGIYAIQNSISGGFPNSDRSAWENYGNYSWHLGNDINIGDDHYYLNLYEETDQPLELNSEKKKDDDEENVFDYNLAMDYNQLYEYGDLEIKIKDADFALIISVDKLLEKEHSKKEIEEKRRNQKENASALLSDDEVKRINIEKYTKQLFSNFGFKEEKIDIKHLEKMILKIVLGKNVLFAIITENYHCNFNNEMKNIMSYIKKILESDLIKEYTRGYISNIYNIYIKINNFYNKTYQVYENNIKYLKEKINNSKETKEELVEMISLIEEISNYIYESIKSENINNLYDLNSLYYSLKNTQLMFNDQLYLDYYIINLLKSVHSKSDLDYYFEILMELDRNIIIKSNQGLKALFKQIKKIY